MIKVILTLNILCVINHVIEEKRCFEIFIWNSGFSSSEVWNFVFTFSLLQWNSEISLMMREHWEYEPIRDIIEKPSFEKRKCKKHLVRGRRSLNVPWRISASETETAAVTILLGWKNPIPYVSEIDVKRAHHLSKRINSLGPFETSLEKVSWYPIIKEPVRLQISSLTS